MRAYVLTHFALLCLAIVFYVRDAAYPKSISRSAEDQKVRELLGLAFSVAWGIWAAVVLF
jgi:hypothetical protein